MIHTHVTCGDCEGICERARDEVVIETWDDVIGVMAELHGDGVLVRDKVSDDLVWWQDKPHECGPCRAIKRLQERRK